MSETEGKGFVALYKKYIDDINKKTDVSSRTVIPGTDAYDKKQADLEEAKLQVAKDQMEMLGLQLNYANRLKDNSKFKKNIQEELDIIKKGLGLPTQLEEYWNKGKEIFGQAKESMTQAETYAKESIEKFDEKYKNFEKTETGKDFKTMVDNFPEYFKKIEEGAKSTFENLSDLIGTGGNLIINEAKNFGGTPSIIDGNSTNVRDRSMQNSLFGITNPF